MRFTVLISHYRRPEIQATLKNNASFFRALDSEIVIATAGPADSILENLPPGLVVRVIERSSSEIANFNKCEALNAAFAYGTADNILLLDADILIAPNDALGISTVPYDRSYGVLKGIRENGSTPTGSKLKTRTSRVLFETNNGLRADVVKSSAVYEPMTFNGTGLLCMSRSAFEDVGGFNEELHGWGWEDVDLQVRLQFAGYSPVEIETTAVHLTHDDTIRASGLKSRYDTEAENSARAIARYEAGLFIGTLSSYAEERTKRWHKKK